MLNISSKTKILFSCLLVAFITAGCSTIADSSAWQTTRKLYYTYVNTPEVINYDENVSLSEAEDMLAMAVLTVDNQLIAFERAMEYMEQPPLVEDVQKFLSQFPWVSGIALMNTQGEITAALPDSYSKPLDFKPLLVAPEKLAPRSLRAIAQDTGVGIEMLVARPVFVNADFVGVFVAYFDMRALFAYVGMDPSVFVLTPDQPLWTGDIALDKTPLAGIDFLAEVKKHPGGKVSNEFGNAIWLHRYLGGLPIIFSVMQHGEVTPAVNVTQ